jgi:hypothetical protein
MWNGYGKPGDTGWKTPGELWGTHRSPRDTLERRTPPVGKKPPLTWADDVLHGIHRAYYYDVPIYLENTKTSSRCPTRGQLKHGIINRGTRGRHGDDTAGGKCSEASG